MRSMTGRTVLITGSTGGIGKQTARGLARSGARVVLVGRDPARAAATAAELRDETGDGAVDFLTADVTRRADLHRLAEEVRAGYGALHVLVNNAGVVRERRELTDQGVESTFAGNVLAPFALAHLLLDALHDGAPARIVNVAGGVPRGRIDVDNLQGERSYNGLAVYNQAKLAMMAMSYEFAARVAGRGVTINVVYPGHAYTDMNKGLSTAAYPAATRPLVPLLKLAMPVLYGGRAAEKAARSSVRLASDAALRGVSGEYFDRKGHRAAWPACATDEHNRQVIWALCARLSGLSVN